MRDVPVRRMLAWGGAFVLAAAAVAGGQTSGPSPSSARKLDERSVLLESQGAAGGPPPVAAAVPAVPATAPGEDAPVENEALDERITEAMGRSGSGQIEESITLFRQVLLEDPANKRARFGLGTAYIQVSRYRDALAILEPMAKEFPSDFSLRNNIAWVYATARDNSVRNGSLAVRYGQEALLLAPDDFHVWNTLSEAYYVSGEYEKSLRSAEQARTLSLRANISAMARREYDAQVDKAQKAVDAMTILE